MKYFYEKNRELLDSSVNKTFEEILWMTKDQFRQWVIDLRKTVVDLWDNKGNPPRVGYDESEIIEQFRQMESFSFKNFLVKDELTGEENVIRNTHTLGNAVNQFFPTMMKTRINYTKNDDGKSIYDYFSRDDLLDTFVTYASRHFKRDSFYHYSSPVKLNDTTVHGSLPVAQTGTDWIVQYENEFRKRGEYAYWLSPKDVTKEYTGYNEELKKQKFLVITKDEIESLGDRIPDECKTNVDYDKTTTYQIRAFKYGQKLFPIGLKAFRVSFCQYAVNFPPLTAKYLYERFTEEFKDQSLIRIYDPSSGWAGRLLGAMSIRDNRNVLYIGTDPNTDHTTSPGRTKYDEVADFYRKNVRKGGLWEIPHTQTEIYQLGSEVIGQNPDFQKHKGLVDFVFTSPPYFAKEAYSEDPEQSYKKFNQYAQWKEGFLRPTLITAVESLRPGRYLLWNIADAKFGGDMLPLEKDSCDILEELGMEFKGILKMSLAQMPGGNRVNETDEIEVYQEASLDGLLTKEKKVLKGKAKNMCQVNGTMLKYEPIFVFFKPIGTL